VEVDRWIAKGIQAVGLHHHWQHDQNRSQPALPYAQPGRVRSQ